MGGRFTVIPAGEELSTYLLHQRFERGIRSLRGGLRFANRDVDSLRIQVSILREANERLEQRVAALERAPEPARRPIPAFPAQLGWGLVALTILFGLVAFRPRRKASLATPVDPPIMERIDDPEKEPALRS